MEPGHRRTDSTSAVTLDDPSLPIQQHARLASSTSSSSSDGDVFPPRRTDAASLPYNPDGMIEFWLHEYEDVLGEVFGEGEGVGEWDDDLAASGFPPSSPRRPSYGSGITGGEYQNDGSRSPVPGSPSTGEFGGDVPMPKAAERDDRAWNALGEMMGEAGDDDSISDSESVVTVGELGEEAHLGSGVEDEARRKERRRSENETSWAVSFIFRSIPMYEQNEADKSRQWQNKP